MTEAIAAEGETAAQRRCTGFEAAEAALVARAARTVSSDAGLLCAPELPAAYGKCAMYGGRTRAWAVALDSVAFVPEDRGRGWREPAGPCAYRAHVSIVHIGDDGAVVRFPLGEPSVFNVYADPQAHERVASSDVSEFASVRPIFDFDGDGMAEAVLEASVSSKGRWSRYGIVTVRQGEIAFYERPLPIPNPSTKERPEVSSTFRDVDRDGRPDLVFFPYGRLFWWTASSDTVSEVDAPAFVAHSLPGGNFAVDDEVARAFALRFCPARPGALLAGRIYGGGVDQGRTERNIVCARVWGMSSKEVLEELGRRCNGYSSRDSYHLEGMRRGACPPEFHAVATAVPPLFLRSE